MYLSAESRSDLDLQPLELSILEIAHDTHETWEFFLDWDRINSLHAYGYAIALHVSNCDYTDAIVPPPLQEPDTPIYDNVDSIITLREERAI